MHRSANTLLTIWGFLAGFTLWLPAYSLPVRGLPPLQPLDLIVLAFIPSGLPMLRQLNTTVFWIVATGYASLLLSWVANGANLLMLGWAVFLGLPFVVMMFFVAHQPGGRRGIVNGFLLVALLSSLLFLAQITFGAALLDFRNNPAFSLPPQYGRGFALLPEVSTFATHTVMAFGVALALLLHRDSSNRTRRRMVFLLALFGLVLLLSRSTSVLVLLPLLIAMALAKVCRANLKSVVLAACMAGAVALFLGLFLNSFYAERLESAAAERSVAMRLSSIIAGLSPLVSGEVFGVGVGENEEIRTRAYQVVREFGLKFGSLPSGVNSQIVGRIFEEGWMVVLHFSIAGLAMIRAYFMRHDPVQSGLFLLAFGSFASALLVSGYRGIYASWLWLSLPAAIATAGPLLRARPPGSQYGPRAQYAE